jgi:Protein of unknown function (DUF2971)
LAANVNRRKYFDRLLNVGPTISERSALTEFKLEILESENGTTKLYKYCGIDTAIKILKNNSLFLNTPEYFNDPFDCLAKLAVWDNETRFSPTASEVEYVQTALLKLPSKYRPIEFRLLHDLRVAYKYAITCFSTDHKSHLMWSHYANHHKGVCIEYDITGMLNDIHPCLYTNEFGNFDWTNGASSLVKSISWEYEHEWRYIKETIRPKMRLLGSVLHQIYNCVHANPGFAKADHEEWSSINDEIIRNMEATYESEKAIQIKPTKLILGSMFSRNQTNTNTAETCRKIFSAARTSSIPIYLLKATKSTFELQEMEITKAESTWLDLDPDLLSSLPMGIKNDTSIL